MIGTLTEWEAMFGLCRMLGASIEQASELASKHAKDSTRPDPLDDDAIAMKFKASMPAIAKCVRRSLVKLETSGESPGIIEAWNKRIGQMITHDMLN